MRLIDANLLIYAYAESLPHRLRIKGWLESVALARRPDRLDTLGNGEA